MEDREVLRATRPIVRHNVWEWAVGVPPGHVIHEAAAMGYLMGKGAETRRAISTVEEWERRGVFRTYWGEEMEQERMREVERARVTAPPPRRAPAQYPYGWMADPN